MRQGARTFTLEFKQEAVRLLETSGKSGIALAKELGIADSVLYRWRKEVRANGETAFPGKGQQTDLEEEVRRLRRENDLLRQERDILKKAAAIFCTTRSRGGMSEPLQVQIQQAFTEQTGWHLVFVLR